jgi:hypothetical protein
MEAGMRDRPRKADVAIYGRISIEADELRRKLQGKLGVGAAKLIERAFSAVDRELNAMEPPE